METEKITVKVIIGAIEKYYNGKQIAEICKEYEIDHELFVHWLEEYKSVALELMELKIENERLRKLAIDAILEEKSLKKRLKNMKKIKRVNDL